jgi:hypothetical protein
MTNRSIQSLLVVAISFFTLVCPTYLRYTNLSEFTPFFTDLNFENPDQDDQPQDQHHGSDIFSLNVFYALSLPGINLFKQLCNFFPPVPSLDPKTSILRC